MCSFTDEPTEPTEPAAESPRDQMIGAVTKLARAIAARELGESVVSTFEQRRADTPRDERVRAMVVHAVMFGYPVVDDPSDNALRGLELAALLDISAMADSMAVGSIEIIVL